jgi:hypothetical protein
MSSSNENNASINTPTKSRNVKYNDEIDLIASNQKIATTIDSSVGLEISPKGNIPKKLSITTSISPPDLIFGSPLNDNNPRKIGKMKAFCYIKNTPLFVIGPDCKLFKNIYFFKKLFIAFL